MLVAGVYYFCHCGGAEGVGILSGNYPGAATIFVRLFNCHPFDPTPKQFSI
jgi:hypothetical protein